MSQAIGVGGRVLLREYLGPAHPQSSDPTPVSEQPPEIGWQSGFQSDIAPIANAVPIAAAAEGGGPELNEREIANPSARDNCCTRLTNAISGGLDFLACSIVSAFGAAAALTGRTVSVAQPAADGDDSNAMVDPPYADPPYDDFVMVADDGPAAVQGGGHAAAPPATGLASDPFFSGLDDALQDRPETHTVFAALSKDTPPRLTAGSARHWFFSFFRRIHSWLWSGGDNRQIRQDVREKLTAAIGGLDVAEADRRDLEKKIASLAGPSRGAIDLRKIKQLHDEITALSGRSNTLPAPVGDAPAVDGPPRDAVRRQKLAELAGDLKRIDSPGLGKNPVMTWDLDSRFDFGEVQGLSDVEKEPVLSDRRCRIKDAHDDKMLALFRADPKGNLRFSCAWGGEADPNNVCVWPAGAPDASPAARNDVLRIVTSLKIWGWRVVIPTELRFEGARVGLYVPDALMVSWLFSRMSAEEKDFSWGEVKHLIEQEGGLQVRSKTS